MRMRGFESSIVGLCRLLVGLVIGGLGLHLDLHWKMPWSVESGWSGVFGVCNEKTNGV